MTVGKVVSECLLACLGRFVAKVVSLPVILTSADLFRRQSIDHDEDKQVFKEG